MFPLKLHKIYATSLWSAGNDISVSGAVREIVISLSFKIPKRTTIFLPLLPEHIFIIFYSANDLHYYLQNMICVFLCNYVFAEMFPELGSRSAF